MGFVTVEHMQFAALGKPASSPIPSMSPSHRCLNFRPQHVLVALLYPPRSRTSPQWLSTSHTRLVAHRSHATGPDPGRLKSFSAVSQKYQGMRSSRKRNLQWSLGTVGTLRYGEDCQPFQSRICRQSWGLTSLCVCEALLAP